MRPVAPDVERLAKAGTLGAVIASGWAIVAEAGTRHGVSLITRRWSNAAPRVMSRLLPARQP